MPQQMGVASSLPMQPWDPMLTSYMQRDYNTHVGPPTIGAAHHGGMFGEDLGLAGMSMAGMGGMGNMSAIAGMDTSRHGALQLPGKFSRASDAAEWVSYGMVDFPAALKRKYEPKEQIGRHNNCMLPTVIFLL